MNTTWTISGDQLFIYTFNITCICGFLWSIYQIYKINRKDQMLYNKVNYGKIHIEKTWEFAINAIHKESNGRIIIRKKHKNNLLCEEMVFDAYFMETNAGHKSYITKIPKELNNYVEKLTGLKREFSNE